MEKEVFPILEYDEDKNAVIRPAHIFKPIEIAKRCVVCNFGEAIETILEEYPHRLAVPIRNEAISDAGGSSHVPQGRQR